MGHVVLAKQQKSLPIHLRDVKVTSGEDWFTAELVVDHGEHVRADLLFTSNRDVCREVTPARKMPWSPSRRLTSRAILSRITKSLIKESRR
jgi:hypothetical protein